VTPAGVAGVLAVALFVAAAKPAAADPADEARALVERAAEHIREYGRKQAFTDFSRHDGGFVDGELYVFCDDATGLVLAHGDNPKLVGKRLSGVRDAEGKLPTKELFEIGQTKGRGWLEYLWPNAETGRIQRKVTYVVRIDDQTVCASGYYKPDQQ
jgi:cytochrome c